MRRPLWFWAAVVVAVGVFDVVLLNATGNGDSGENDGAGQVFGFFVFLGCVALLLILGVVAAVGYWRRRRVA